MRWERIAIRWLTMIAIVMAVVLAVGGDTQWATLMVACATFLAVMEGKLK